MLGATPLRMRHTCSAGYRCALCHDAILPGQSHHDLLVSGEPRRVHSECARAALEAVVSIREHRDGKPQGVDRTFPASAGAGEQPVLESWPDTPGGKHEP